MDYIKALCFVETNQHIVFFKEEWPRISCRQGCSRGWDIATDFVTFLGYVLTEKYGYTGFIDEKDPTFIESIYNIEFTLWNKICG